MILKFKRVNKILQGGHAYVVYSPLSIQLLVLAQGNEMEPAPCGARFSLCPSCSYACSLSLSNKLIFKKKKVLQRMVVYVVGPSYALCGLFCSCPTDASQIHKDVLYITVQV